MSAVSLGTTGDEVAVVGRVFDAWVAGDDEATIDGGERIKDIVRRVVGVLTEVADWDVRLRRVGDSDGSRTAAERPVWEIDIGATCSRLVAAVRFAS